jgi:ribonuclease R
MKAGSLDLDFPETKIRLDERGRISRIERVENDVSHQLIEEFMLLANEAAAIRLKDLKRPAIYRVHEPPDETRLEEFRQDVLNHQIRCGNLRGRAEIQRLLHKLNSFSFGPALKIGFLRSMMRARYQTEPLGHYGLAKANYTHFTSPIRRYVDLAVHRALFEKSGRPADQSPKQIADHISKTERLSDDAERSSKRIKLLHYLADQLAAKKLVRYEANVIDVRNFGFFVDVPDLGISGLVPLSTLKDEFYQFNFARKELVGRRTRRLIKLGDRVKVKVANVDFFKKQIDFGLAE